MSEPFRQRLASCVREALGEVSPRTVKELSVKARVHYTTLARCLLYQSDKQTRRLRRATVDAVASALEVNAVWLLDGQGAKQLGIWPIMTRLDAEAVGEADSVVQAVEVLEQVRRLPLSTQLRAARAAVSAVLEAVVGSGGIAPPEAYRCLMRLDAMHRQLEAAG